LCDSARVFEIFRLTAFRRAVAASRHTFVNFGASTPQKLADVGAFVFSEKLF